MRESGFDPSNRFGPFSVDIIHHARSAWNVLLYRWRGGAEIARVLGDAARPGHGRRGRGPGTGASTQYLWDEATGLYLDYKLRGEAAAALRVPTTFYPLWAGLASRRQAARVVKNLPLFEAPRGILTSTQTTGNQWDAPFGWAPLQAHPGGRPAAYGYERTRTAWPASSSPS